MKHLVLGITLLLSVTSLSVPLAQAPELRVVAFSPARLAMAPVDASISIVFDRPVDPATVHASNVRVFGHASGTAGGTFSFSHANRVVTLDPAQSFFHGEVVRVNVSRFVRGADLSPMRTAGYAFQFTTWARPASGQFTQIDMMTVEDGGPNPRIYGAQASDLDGDGWIDLGAVNEDSSDIRVFLNTADGSGLFEDFLVPPTETGGTPSPNESADFDNDGHIDICTANTSTASVSIVLGAGDGTFSSHQEVAVGAVPHGIAVLDMDGDADLDIATANTQGNNVSILFNDGAGVFGPATSFEGGGTHEWGLGAGDMNNDGIDDLVVGAHTSERILVQLGRGDGTFTPMPFQGAGGLVWMLALGDLDGDGNLDVSSANSTNNNGSILLGNGDGTLRPRVITPMAGHVPATDLGDLDGDGDLDWILSSFGAGHWRVFRNDGQGAFTFDQQFNATSNPSCAIVLDFDRDRDMDLVLTDEISNDIFVEQNAALAGDGDGDGVAAGDCAPANGALWALPGEALALRLHHSGGPGGLTVLSWKSPARPGSSLVAYDTVRAELRDGFTGPTATCIETNDGSDTLAVDASTPASIYYYLVRGENGCGQGSAGVGSDQLPRVVGNCP
jgi:hypothetical protein